MARRDAFGQGGPQDGASPIALFPEDRKSAVLVVNARQLILSLDSEAERLIGIEPSRVVGKSFDSLPPPLREFIAATMSGDPSPPVRRLTLDGSPGKTLRVQAFRVAEGGAEPLVIILIDDLSREVQTRAAIGHLDRLATLGTFAASLAHECRNALVAIKTFLELLIRRNADQELAATAHRELARVEELLSQMLHFASPSSGPSGPTGVHEVIERTLALLSPQLAMQQIRLQREFHAGNDTINGDAAPLQQAFLNLVLNAIEAMGPHGTLTIATRQISAGDSASDHDLSGSHRSHLEVTIQDTGVGIARENLDRVFQPFFTTKVEGVGLGLAITRRIVQEHQGKIRVMSEPGRGATLVLTFPVLDRQP